MNSLLSDSIALIFLLFVFWLYLGVGCFDRGNSLWRLVVKAEYKGIFKPLVLVFLFSGPFGLMIKILQYLGEFIFSLLDRWVR